MTDRLGGFIRASCRAEPPFFVPVCEETGHLWKELQEISGKSFPTMEILWIVPARSCAPLQRNQYGRIWK
ncbi:hypothetical protein DXB82_16180 [Phocaeicola vulgatus]|uniref:hypothetical protein n=1 Tax=Phocaeicola vulgatus TaxID=821 RepID=UPI000E43A5FD|nr:hypothetical protein [Phocaeicola vulgatus]RGN01868.1 hypothetical protein DXB82_16180 [Phocaeicola vulgatus]